MGANLYDPTVQDYNTYIRFANQIIGSPCTKVETSDSSVANRCAELAITPGKTYVVSGDFSNRFRVATLKRSNCKPSYTLTNYIFDPLDDNGTAHIGSGRTLTIAAGDDHDMMLIGYYSANGTIPHATIRDSIRVVEFVPEPIIYTVMFNTDGGSLIEPESITEGGTVTAPTAPTKEGYTFAGWYREPDFTTPWDFITDTITADTVIYAKWTKKPEPEPPATVKISPCFGWQGIFVKR